MSFEFSAPGQTLFGPGRIRELPPLLHAWGQRFLVVTGRSAARVRPLVESLEQEGLEPRLLSVQGEPTVDVVTQGCRIAVEQRVDGVVAFGGGSPLDAAKAIAVLAANPGDVLDYLEIVGEGRPLEKPGLPCAAIPTTAGSGAEATRNAVLASPEHRVKVSLRSHSILPRLTVVDPELTYHLPPRPTAATGLDALTQLIEAFVSHRANPLTDALCREGIRRVARSLGTAYSVALRMTESPDTKLTELERNARADLAFAAHFSGLALANAGLGAVHGFAGPIGGMFQAPHGEVCAVLLPLVMTGNVEALRDRAPEHPALARYAEVAALLCGPVDATIEDGLTWVRQTLKNLAVPGLADHGISEADLPTLVSKASKSSSMKGNPIPLTPEELTTILQAAL